MSHPSSTNQTLGVFHGRLLVRQSLTGMPETSDSQNRILWGAFAVAEGIRARIVMDTSMGLRKATSTTRGGPVGALENTLF